jgi:hypothetical protein
MEPREVFSERSGGSGFRRPTLLETKWGWALTALIGLWGLGLLAHGIVTLVAPNFRGDLFLRWNEQQLLLQGIDPYDVSALNAGLKPSASEQARIESHRLREIGPIIPSGYPPWAFTLSFLFIYPLSLRVDQLLFAAWSVAGLAVTLSWAYQFGRPCGRGAACIRRSATWQGAPQQLPLTC